MKFSRLFLVMLVITGFMTACSKDDDATVVIKPSDGSTLTLNGGGGTGAPNTVYVDLSADSSTAVKRTSWSLGFYSGSDDYRVILNGFSSMSAKATAKTDITTVTLDDATGVSMAIGQGQGTMSMIDDVYGDLTKSVIASVSATDANNYVYLIKPESASATDASTWYKVRVTRSSNGYTLQYALLGATDINTATITKNNDYNFVFFSFDTKATVTVEPKKAEWDLAWSYATYFAAYNGGSIPYLYSDFVVTNEYNGVTAAKVDSTTVGYSSFASSNIAALTFSSARDAIGSTWRATTGDGIYKNFYYIIKDPAGNYYKLKFVSMGINDGGSRGYPVIEYKLVKSAS